MTASDGATDNDSDNGNGNGGDSGPDRRRIVVGGALLHRGRVLAARRSAPAETAGRWEFPGVH